MRRLLFALFLFSFVTFSARADEKEIVKLRCVVIDPGHGGKDGGASYGKLKEKDITLSISLMLGRHIKENYPDIKVVYTRSSDKFLELEERTAIANRAKADLFISIHVNSAKAKAAKGSETFVMGLDKGNKNMEVCFLENSVITMEDNYMTKYQGFDPKDPESYIMFSLLQNSHIEQSLSFASEIQNKFKAGPITTNRGVKQAGFFVLWKCSMPSVLIETGFISNESDRKLLSKSANQSAIARSIFEAFKNYKAKYETKIDISSDESGTEPVIEKHYRIQIMALGRLLDLNSKEFKGLKCEYIRSGDMYKYTVGHYATQQEAREDILKIKKLFPNAYIITVE